MRTTPFESCQPHEFLFGIGSGVDNFCCRLAMNGIVDLVLDFLEELD